MKTSKKLLYIGTSVLITSLISAGLAAGMFAIFGISFPHAFFFWFAAQVLGFLAWERYGETQKILKSVEEYNKKPYKKYWIPLNCAHCGHKNEIEIDLTDTEFRCPNCLKFNGIHVNFMAAAITEPLSQIER